MALPNTGITTNMVGTAIGSGSRDVGTLCNHPQVNKWSINKPMLNSPVSRDPLEPDSLKQFTFNHAYLANRVIRDEYHYWYLHYIRAEDWSKPNSDTWSNAGKLYPELPAYRLGDFRGYDHSALRPKINSRKAEIKISSNGLALHVKFIVNTQGIDNLRPILTEIGSTGKIFKFEETGQNWVLNGLSYIKTVPTTGAIFIGDDMNTVNTLNSNLMIDIPHTLTFFNGTDWSYVDIEDIPTDTSSGFNTEDKNYSLSIDADIPLDTNYYRVSRPKLLNSSYNAVPLSSFVVNFVSLGYTQDVNYPDPADGMNAIQILMNYTLQPGFYSSGVPTLGLVARCAIELHLYSVNPDGSLNNIIEPYDFSGRVYLEVGSNKDLYMQVSDYTTEEKNIGYVQIAKGLTSNPLLSLVDTIYPNYAFQIRLRPINFFTPS